MELTLVILLLLAFIASRTGRNRRKKARRARCARLSEETRAARGAQVISIEECAARCGQTLYEKGACADEGLCAAEDGMRAV